MSLISAITGTVVTSSNGSSFPITPELTAIAVQYSNPAATLIADDIMPMTPPMGTKPFKWTQFELGNSYTIPDLEVGPRSTPTQYEVPGEEIRDECIPYGLEAFIPNADINQAASLRAENQSLVDPQMLQTETLTDVVILGRERRVANIVFNPANYRANLTTDLATGGHVQFSDFANSDPIETIGTYLDSTVVRANILVFGQSSWTVVRRHPNIMKAINKDAGDKGMATRQAVADLFEVDKILVGASFVNITGNRKTPTIARTWGPHIAGLYVNPQAARSKGLTWGFTANYRGRTAGAIPDMRTGDEGGVWVRVMETCKEVVAAPDVGWLIRNATVAPTGLPQQN